MGRLSSSSRGGGRLAAPKTSSSGGFTPEQLDRLVEQKGLPPIEKKKSFSMLRAVGRVLNIGTATVAGAARGIIRKDKSIGEGIKEGIQKNIGFSDVIREDLGINPKSRLGKIAVGGAGFIADVVFDPITYLTFGAGAGLKVGGKVLTKGGTKLAQTASRELVEEGLRKATVRGLSGRTAEEIAFKGVAGRTNELIMQSFGKKGLTQEAAEDFIKAGVSEKTIYAMREMGPKLIDQGGIKFFGQTLITSKTLGKTPIGKAAKRLGETEIAVALKNTLAKTFVADWGKSPKLVNILDNAKRSSRQAMQGIFAANTALFKDLSDDEMSHLFNNIFEKKVDIIRTSQNIEEGTIKELNGLFPDLKITGRDKAASVLSNLEDDTVKKISAVREKVDEIVKPFFEKRQAAIRGSTAIEASAGKVDDALKVVDKVDFTKVDDLNKIVDGLKEQLAALRKGRGVTPAAKETIKGVTREELDDVAQKLMRYEEERLTNVIDDLSKHIENFKPKPGVAGKAAKKLSKASPGEMIVQAERMIMKFQEELTTKSKLLGKVMDSRRIAKAQQKVEKLVFDNPKLQAVSDALFEGDDAIVKRFAKLAGLSDEDAIKFYIPSKFMDKLQVKDFAIGRNMSSPTLGFLKKFTGVDNPNLIKDPFEAYTRGQVEVVTARIKGDAFKTTVRQLGRPLESMTAEEAARRGMVKVTRKGVEGELAGYFPKEMADEINKFLDPDKVGTIDELARVTGFDYVTGLFKGYVTSLFPGFHIRNMTSNQFQNMLKIGLDTMNPGMQKRALDIALNRNARGLFKTKMGKVYTNDEIRKLLSKESDIIEGMSGKYGALEQLLDNRPDALSRLSKLSMFNPLSRDNVALKAGRKVGNIAETQAKLVGVLNALNDGKSIKEGIAIAEDAIFNYAKLAPMEKSIMRRVIPFYTFARKNAEFQLRMLATNPGRVAAEMKAIKGLGEAVGEPITEEDIKGLPGYILDNLGIKAGANSNGQSQFLTGFGLPIEEFLGRFSGEKGIVWNFFQKTMAQMNPIIKLPTERATGTDFFRGRPITEVTNAKDLVPFFAAMPEGVAKELKDIIQFREIPNQPIYANGKVVAHQSKYVANPFALHWLRNLPSARIQGTAGFMADDNEGTLMKSLRFFTGIRGFAIDQEYQQFINELEEKRELEDYLIRMGVLKKFETTYQPKGKKIKSGGRL